MMVPVGIWLLMFAVWLGFGYGLWDVPWPLKAMFIVGWIGMGCLVAGLALDIKKRRL